MSKRAINSIKSTQIKWRRYFQLQACPMSLELTFMNLNPIRAQFKENLRIFPSFY